MQSSDITRSVFIFLIFGMLFLFSIWSIGLKNIQKKWPIYRCNPMVMPFASLFGHDTMKNFVYCINNMQTGYMGNLLQPIHYKFDMMTDITSSLGSSLNDARGFINKFRNNLASITKNTFGVFSNLIVETQRLIAEFKDTMSKMVGVMITFMYTITGVNLMANSVWNGPPGETVRFFACFAPSTLVKLKDGSLLKMKDIKLNSILSNGARVLSIMNISNINENGNYNECYYELPGGVDNRSILVTGNHLIFDEKKKKYIHVKDFHDAKKSTTPPTETLSCLITSNHTIAIGSRLFHDWEDYQV